ncbi:MAG: phosphatidate cytidylyltransferase [Bacteroidales bacterium]
MKSNFLTRVVTSAVFVIVLIGGILLNPVSFFILFGIIVVLGLFEFYKISSNETQNPQIYPGILLGVFIYTALMLISSAIAGIDLLIYVIPLVLIILISELYRKKTNPLANISITLLGSLYVAVPFGLLGFMVFSSHEIVNFDPSLLIAYFAIIWVNDSAAYIVGSAIGRHRLFERISPKKSWEGFFGGAICSLLVAYLISIVYVKIKLTDSLAIAVCTFTFGTFGDLFESLLKRSVNIKDSGHLLPGHGGILDRFDSLILSSPIVFVYLTISA